MILKNQVLMKNCSILVLPWRNLSSFDAKFFNGSLKEEKSINRTSSSNSVNIQSPHLPLSHVDANDCLASLSSLRLATLSC